MRRSLFPFPSYAFARTLVGALFLLVSFLLSPAFLFAASFAIQTEGKITTLLLSFDAPWQIGRIEEHGRFYYLPLKDFALLDSLPKPAGAIEFLSLDTSGLSLFCAPQTRLVGLDKQHSTLVLTFLPLESTPKTWHGTEVFSSFPPGKNAARLLLPHPLQIPLPDTAQYGTSNQASASSWRIAQPTGPDFSSTRLRLRNRRSLPYSELRKILEEEESLPKQSLFPSTTDTHSAKEESLSFWKVFQHVFAGVQANFSALAFAAEGSGRALSLQPQDIRARVNLGGPEDWPEKEAIQTRPDTGQEKPKPADVPLSPEETFIPAEERQSATTQGGSQTFPATMPDTISAVEDFTEPAPGAKEPDKEREFPKNEVPQVSPGQEAFPKNEVPGVSQGAEERFPKNEVPQVSPGQEAFPKNEVPGVSPGTEERFPKNEVPQVSSGQEAFPKNEVPGSSDTGTTAAPASEKPFPPNTVPGEEKKPAQAQGEAQPAGKKVESSVHGVIRGEQEGVVTPKPEEKKPEEEKQVIYVDEKGNPVEKPLDIAGMFKEALELLEQKKYDEAIALFSRLKETGSLNAEQLEAVLYGISDCYWYLYEKDVLAGYDQILSSTNEALNNNLRSERVPEALLRLCLANLAVGNTLDAEGYITAILRRYPSYPGTATGLCALGKSLLEKKQYAKAEKYFSTILDKYPESSLLKDASIGLIEVFYYENAYDRAKVILDFANKRWPRHYVDNPSFLLIEAALEKAFGHIDKQVQTLWQLYNIQPASDHTVPMFLEMGDIYLRIGNLSAASFLYQEILRIAPESEEAISASLRLAEKGFYNSPLFPKAMFELFGRGSNPPFRELYTDIGNRSQTNPDAILARLKLVLWYYWDKQYPEAMGQAADFIDRYPEHPDKKIAEDIIWDSFKQELDMSFTEQNYARILTLWNGFPLVRKRYGAIDPKLRYALAQGQRERGDEEGALNLLRTFLRSPMDPDYGEVAFLEFFNIYLAQGNWNAILDLGKTVANWKMKPELRQDLDYALALSAQNLNLEGTALNYWKKIADNPDAQLYQKAWAMVFIAQDAERRKDIREAYNANMKIVDYFTQLQEERSDKADPERIKNAMLSLMDICEVANHIPEALQWVNRYRSFAQEGSEEYAALRYRESRLYRKLGDANRSQALLEELVRHYQDSPYAQAARSELQTFEISRDLQSFQGEPLRQPPQQPQQPQQPQPQPQGATP